MCVFMHSCIYTCGKITLVCQFSEVGVMLFSLFCGDGEFTLVFSADHACMQELAGHLLARQVKVCFRDFHCLLCTCNKTVSARVRGLSMCIHLAVNLQAPTWWIKLMCNMPLYCTINVDLNKGTLLTSSQDKRIFR